MFASLRRALPRLGRLPRLLLAGCCVLLALGSALGGRHGAPARARTVPVVVAARALPAGHLLDRADLALAHWPAELRPAAARASPGELLGRRLAGPVDRHEAITATRLVGAELVSALPAGLVATPVPLGDPQTVDLVRAGERVDLLEAARPPDVGGLPQPGKPAVHTVAERTVVLAVLPARADADAELVLAVDRPTAVRITRDSADQVFTAVVDAP